MKLHELKPAEGAVKSRKRLGRGTATGQGKTAVTSVPFSNLFKSSTLTSVYIFLNGFLKPLLGSLLASGICPPSNPTLTPPPEREV